MRGLAFRRFQQSKKKRWAKRTFSKYYTNFSDSVVGIRANSPAICSCPICGNQRKHWGKPISEIRLEQEDEC